MSKTQQAPLTAWDLTFQPLQANKVRDLVRQLESGSTIFCRNPDALLSKVIRWGLKSDADHTATVVWRDGQPKILEAKGGEKSYLKCFYAWIRERENQTFWLSPVKTTPDIEKRIADCIGRKYDYGAVLVWMVIFQGTGIWFGPTNLKALDRMFCHEMSAYIRGKKEWWCLNRPNNLGDFK